METDLTELLIILNAAAAVFFEWVPPVKKRWDLLEGWQKRLIILGLAVASAVALFLIGCSSDGWETCGPRLGGFLSDLVIALMASQGTHLATKRS